MSLQQKTCPVCAKLHMNAIYCSVPCAKIVSSAKRRKYFATEKTCPFCKKLFTSINQFCSRKCQNYFLAESRRGIPRTEEVCAAISKGKTKHPRLQLPFRSGKLVAISEAPAKNGEYCWNCVCDCGGTTISREKDLLDGGSTTCGCSRKNKRKWHRKRPQSKECIEKRIAAVSQLILEGKYTPQDTYSKATSKSIQTRKGGIIRCNSSWEEVYAKFLDYYSGSIYFEKDKPRIPYIDEEGKKRIYIADFFVQFRNSKMVIEIKPKCFIANKTVQLKAEAAKAWCTENGAQFTFVDEDVISDLRLGTLPDSFREQERKAKKLKQEIREYIPYR